MSYQLPMAFLTQLRISDFLILGTGVWVATKIVKQLTRTRGTRLNGPPRDSWLLGVGRRLSSAVEPAEVFEEWAAEYGSVFEQPMALGGSKLVLTDPRAVNHFYASERSVYIKTQMTRNVIGNLIGHGLLYAEGEDHKRQRKALTPAFSNAAIRRLTEVFFDSAYKLKSHWDTQLEGAPDGVVMDVEAWMNRVALDSIGIAGFSHEFRSLDGEASTVADAFDAMAFNGNRASIINLAVFLLGTQIPFLAHLPTPRNRLTRKLKKTLGTIAEGLLEKTRKDKANQQEAMDKSVIGLLLKAEQEDAELHMDKEEITAQMNVLLLAGYETTSISMTWALIELCRRPDIQAKLRDELTSFGPQDATWDQLTSSLPYLDAVVLEILRLHPAVPETTRQAQTDDVIPLSEPITAKSGELVTQIAVPKDTVVTVSIRCMNRSTAFWGPDAAEFRPERWLTFDVDDLRAKAIQGHRHLITFLDGPRQCLGKQFALAEFKAVLSVLIKNYSFELPGGPKTDITTVLGLIRRPKVVGEEGPVVPLRIRRAE
ncbi:hypothetical protein MIND_01349300 [Mycena indigotica]|uniref:Cytochrome P450 n=1 Tax=Mycena indigotica TaxID=2126181 RepID=A0A8H6VPX9_9AGAR|nr:uncharacterized protein MIND_01349300 [Mycena indigotica]KAF7289757.1 hypothetical protein MIND_01349300 [Mycena indigotica]